MSAPPPFRSLQTIEFRLRMDDGALAPATLWTPLDPPRATVLGLHSFGDYRRAFEALGPFLALRGIACLAYDQRGFGDTRPFGRWARPDRYLEDAIGAARFIRRQSQGPVFAIGESMGGGVGLMLAACKPHLVDGLVLANPAVRRNQPYGRAIDLAIAGLGLIAPLLAYPDDRNCSTIIEPARVRLTRDPRVVRRVRAGALSGVMRLSRAATLAARAVRAPTLLLHGGQDWLIHANSIAALREDLSGPVDLLAYPRLPHLILQCHERWQVFADIATWLDSRIDALGRPRMAPGRVEVAA